MFMVNNISNHPVPQKKFCFSGKDEIYTCKDGIIIPFTASEGDRLTPNKTRYTATYFDGQGDKLRFAKLSRREPQNYSGWIQREKIKGSVNEILGKSNLQPILSKKLDTELERLLRQLASSETFELLQSFAEQIIQDKTSDFMDIQLAIKAIVTCELYISSRTCLKYSPEEAQEFCLNVAEDVYQCIASQYVKQISSSELFTMMSVYFNSLKVDSYTPGQLNYINAMVAVLPSEDLFKRTLPLFLNDKLNLEQ